MTNAIITFCSLSENSNLAKSLVNTGKDLLNFGYRVLFVDLNLSGNGLFDHLVTLGMVSEEVYTNGVLDLLVDKQVFNLKDLVLNVEYSEGINFGLLPIGINDFDANIIDLKDKANSSFGGASSVEIFRANLKTSYDFVLIDAGQITSALYRFNIVQLPDVVVILSPPGRVFLDGLQRYVRIITKRHQELRFDRQRLIFFPVFLFGMFNHKFFSNYVTEFTFRGIASAMKFIYRDWCPVSMSLANFVRITSIDVPRMRIMRKGYRLRHQRTKFFFDVLAGVIANDFGNIELLELDPSRYFELAFNSQIEFVVGKDKK